MKTNNQIKIHALLRNENIISGESNIDKFDFTTSYGNLVVPITDVTKIEFGLIANEEVKQKVDALVDFIQTATEKEKKRAYESLVNAEISAIAILEAYKENDLELSEGGDLSIQSAYDELRSRHDITDFITEDIITIKNEFNFPGVVALNELVLNTEFGILTIPRNKIKNIEIEWERLGEKTTTKFVLDASKNIPINPAGGWLKTGIKLKKNQPLNIVAKGEIVLASLSNQPHKPNGSYLPVGSSWIGGNDDPNAAPIFGNVIYKIGNDSVYYKVGSKLQSKAYGSGYLYLSIFETVFNTENNGEYQITVKVG